MRKGERKISKSGGVRKRAGGNKAEKGEGKEKGQ